MKRIALLSFVVAVAALTLAATSDAKDPPKSSEPTVGVMYDRFELEPEGILSVANAEGMFIEVFAATGEPVWCGVVPAGYFAFDCPNRGEGVEGEVLHVVTSGGAQFCIDRDEDWIWD